MKTYCIDALLKSTEYLIFVGKRAKVKVMEE